LKRSKAASMAAKSPAVGAIIENAARAASRPAFFG